jgi:hypothetical protein
MVRLTEGVHGELPIAGGVVDVTVDRSQIIEIPGREFVIELLAEQVVEIDGAIGIWVYEQQAVALLGGQLPQSETFGVDFSEVIWFRQTDEIAGRVIGPGVKRTGESSLDPTAHRSPRLPLGGDTS